MAEMSDAEVFGSAPKVMSDAEVFGTSTPAAPKVMSDTDVGLPSSKPGVLDYLGETGKAFATGAVEAAVASPMRGYAGMHGQEALTEPAVRQQALEGIMQGQDIDVAVAGAQGAKPIPVTQHPLYQAAEAISGALPKDKGILNPVVRDIASGVGSVGGNIASMMVPGFNLLGIPNVVAQGAGEATERAVKAGATPDQIQNAARLGNISGATEFADGLLVRTGSWGAAAGLIKQVGLRALQGAMIEGGQEGLQQFIQNVIAKGIYKPDQSLSEDVAYNAVIGAIVGGGTSAAIGGHTPTTTAPTPEDVSRSVTSVNPEPMMAPGVTQVTPGVTPEVPVQPAVVEAPPAPTVEETKAVTLDPQIVSHIQRELPPLKVPNTRLEFTHLITPSDEHWSQLKEEIQSSPGANTARLAKLLGPKLYGDPSNIATVSVKEMFQNSFDAIKGVLEKKGDTEGNIDINMDPRTRTISVTDDGSGMTPEVLGKQFLEIAGTNKETKRASGGLGIAKMLFIFGNKNLVVKTMRNGKVAELNTTGEQLFSALDDKSKAPPIQVRSPTSQDLKQFPKGRGTVVEVKVPEQYQDPSTGEMREIQFDDWEGSHGVLRHSPLFDNINVKFNGSPLEMGTQFPLENYTQFANVNFDWGTARIYVTRTPDDRHSQYYNNNLHVLSNGLWQFSGKIKKDPNKPYGENIAHELYVDVNPRAAPEEPGYPFDLNRQNFSPTSKKDFENIFTYVGLLYRQAGMRQEAENFGTMQFLDYDAETKGVKAAPSFKVEPKTPPPPNAVTLIKPGDKVRVEDGQLIVNGRKVPELTPKELAAYEINPDELRIPQSEIDPRRVILHDNTEIVVSPLETRSVVDYGRERFGERFDQYVFSIGNAFKELRDVVVRYMPSTADQTASAKLEDVLDGLENMLTPGKSAPSMGAMGRKIANVVKKTNGYEELGKEGIGISFDPEYRGVSIKLPFSGMFINPAVPEYTDPLRAAVGMVGTMVHELAHYKVRNHGAEFPAEMQRILIMLDTNTNFNFHAFKQKVINIVASYEDVLTHMNGVFTSGDFNVRPRGKRFQDSSSDEARDGRLSQDLAGPRDQPESGAQLSHWASKSETVSSSESGRDRPALEAGPSGGNRPSDNGRGRNYATLRGIDPGITAPPQQPEVNALRQSVTAALGTPMPPQVKEAATHADRMNWFYKWMIGLTQLQDKNPYFQPLRRYAERVRQMHNDETRVHDAAVRILKDWRGLSDKGKALEALVLDVQDMPYLTPGERKLQTWRHPTAAEFDMLVRKHKVSAEALKVYNDLRTIDETFLRHVEQEAIEAARRTIQDQTKLISRIDEIRSYGRMARAQPFFPFTRFGRYYLQVKDAAGKVVHFETFEPKRAPIIGVQVKSAERYQQAQAEKLRKKVPPGHTVETGVLPETAEPLIGMPTLLLQQMQSPGGALTFTADQIAAIQQIQGLRNPAMSLGNRALYGDRSVTGHSIDLQRSFAKYYFHGGRYLAKIRHAWALRGHIAEAQLSPGNKAGLITSYMSDHLQNTVLDTKGDFGFFKGAVFLWAMGYSMAAATQNVTQTPMVTLPFLAGKFGDVRASAALVNAMRKVSTFYRRGAYDNATGFEMKALEYGIKTGRISETQAPELAGISMGSGLNSSGSAAQRGAIKFQEKAALMFEIAEQFNRRIAYRAALELAQKSPNAKVVDEAVRKYQDEYRQLVAEFGGEAPARAVITAIHAVDQTQFVYAKYARARFMRGKAGILFVFKQYIQSLLTMLSANKSDVLPRYLVMAMLMGGLGGVPGYDDLKGIFRAFAKWFFGKDFDVERAIREHIISMFDGRVPPDLILHGLARRGFGIPALVDLLGEHPSRGFVANEHSKNIPFPVLDRSRAITSGNILPIDIGKMMQPDDKIDKTISDQTQKASGAVFSVGFNMYKAAFDPDLPASDIKRWEKAMPRALSSASRAYRAFTEGRERGKGTGPNGSPTVVNYDPRDPEQFMEILAMVGGYQPLRQQAQWDKIIAKAEVQAFYDFKRKGLLSDFFEARKGTNPDELSKVREEIQKFNRELPDWAKGRAISGDTILKSVAGRERAVIAKESGVPTQKTNVGISRHIDALFPESVIDVRRVR